MPVLSFHAKDLQVYEQRLGCDACELRLPVTIHQSPLGWSVVKNWHRSCSMTYIVLREVFWSGFLLIRSVNKSPKFEYSTFMSSINDGQPPIDRNVKKDTTKEKHDARACIGAMWSQHDGHMRKRISIKLPCMHYSHQHGNLHFFFVKSSRSL